MFQSPLPGFRVCAEEKSSCVSWALSLSLSLLKIYREMLLLAKEKGSSAENEAFQAAPSHVAACAAQTPVVPVQPEVSGGKWPLATFSRAASPWTSSHPRAGTLRAPSAMAGWSHVIRQTASPPHGWEWRTSVWPRVFNLICFSC